MSRDGKIEERLFYLCRLLYISTHKWLIDISASELWMPSTFFVIWSLSSAIIVSTVIASDSAARFRENTTLRETSYVQRLSNVIESTEQRQGKLGQEQLTQNGCSADTLKPLSSHSNMHDAHWCMHALWTMSLFHWLHKPRCQNDAHSAHSCRTCLVFYSFFVHLT